MSLFTHFQACTTFPPEGTPTISLREAPRSLFCCNAPWLVFLLLLWSHYNLVSPYSNHLKMQTRSNPSLVKPFSFVHHSTWNKTKLLCMLWTPAPSWPWSWASSPPAAMLAFPHFWNHFLPQCFVALLCPGPHTLTSSLDFSFCNWSPQGASYDALSKVAPPYSPFQLPIRIPLILIYSVITCVFSFN